MRLGVGAGLLVGLLLVQCSKHNDPKALATSELPPEAQTQRFDAAPEADTAAVDPVAPPEPGEPERPMTAAERTKALAGIAQLQNLMRRRASLGKESDDACDVRHTKDVDTIDALKKQIGQRNLDSKTRFSEKPPFLDATVETFAVFCIGCIGLEEDEVDRKECGMAVTALADLAEKLKAAR